MDVGISAVAKQLIEIRINMFGRDVFMVELKLRRQQIFVYWKSSSGGFVNRQLLYEINGCRRESRMKPEVRLSS